MPQTTRLYKILGKFDRPLERIRTGPDTFTSSVSQTLSILLNRHFPGDVYPSVQDLRAADEDLIYDIVTPTSTSAALRSFHPFRSPGPDGFCPSVLQIGSDIIANLLCQIFRASLITGHIPEMWTKSKVVFIPKPGKTDYDTPSSWRPISLMCFPIKVLERILDRHLRSATLVAKLKSNHQFAYVEGGSTEAALHRLVGYLEKNKFEQRPSLVAFVDIEGAFNNISRESIVNGLRRFDINPTLVRWVDHFLSRRALVTSQDGQSANKLVSNGCPQGSVCSPIYWNVALDSLLEVLKSRFPSLLIQAFADDICLAASGICRETIALQVKAALATIRDWCGSNGLSLNVDKTDLLWIDQSRKASHPEIHISGKPITVKKEVRYLGIIIDQRLNWNAHVRKKASACSSKLAMCHRAIGKTWGLKPSHTNWVYKAIVRPCLDYGCLVWIPAIQTKFKIKSLEQVQRTALLMSTGALRTSPTSGLEVILGLPPIDLFLRGQAMRAWRRLIRTNSALYPNSKTGHVGWIKENIGPLPLTQIHSYLSDRCPNVDIGNKSYLCANYSRSDWETGRCTVKASGITCFTDGSAQTEIDGSHSTGCGVVIIQHQPKRMRAAPFHLGKLSTVFGCEMEGIRRAASKLRSLKVQNQEITIYSDNLSCIHALRGIYTNSRATAETHSILQTVGSTNRLTVEWIPGHRGYYGNESADRLAKEGCKRFFPSAEPLLPIRESVINTEIRHWVEDLWQSRWRANHSCRQTKLWIPYVRIKPRPSALHFGRQDLRTIVGIITGHTMVKKHLHTIGVSSDPFCVCGEVESAIHIIADCPLYVMNRLLHFQRAVIGVEELTSLSYKRVLSYIMATGSLAEGLQQSA